MVIDIVFCCVMCIAVFMGLRKGLIVAVFSIIGWIAGLMAAFKFSAVAAQRLEGTLNLSPRVLYIVAFILVFVVVILVINLGAKLIEKTVQLAMLGWVNRIGGMLFYVLLYVLIFSVVILFAEKVKLLNEETISSSKVYGWVKPLGHIIQRPFLH